MNCVGSSDRHLARMRLRTRQAARPRTSGVERSAAMAPTTRAARARASEPHPAECYWLSDDELQRIIELAQSSEDGSVTQRFQIACLQKLSAQNSSNLEWSVTEDIIDLMFK